LDQELKFIYKDIISVLSYVEMAVENEKQFTIIRKKLLDIANDIKRLQDGSNK
jgi:hypothetical protein